MTYLERQILIKNIFNNKHSCSIKELASELGVSYNTVHTDIDALIKQGFSFIKIHGNIILEDTDEAKEMSNIHIRSYNNISEKKTIAKIVLENLPQKEFSCFFDASTTNLEIAKLLHLHPYRITCITHFIELALITGKNLQMSTILSGGTWWEMEHTTLGDTTINEISNYHTDIAILGCSGINIEEGIFNAYVETNVIKQIMAKNSTEVWLVFDHSKWNKKILTHIFDFSAIDVIITDKMPSEKWINFLNENKIKLIY